MYKRRIISFLLLIVIIITSFASFAAPQNETYVIDNGHGEFKLDSGFATFSNRSNPNKIKVRQVDTDLYDILDKDILVDNKDYDKLIKVNDETLLRVKEIKIKLTNSKQLEDIIMEYEINPMMAEDLRELSLKAQEKDSNIDKELVIYTPKFKKEKNDDSISTFGLGYQARYYYSGYGGYDYMDEIWSGSSSPRFKDIATGSGVKRYLSQVFTNLVNLIIGNYADTQTGGIYSLLEIFAGSPVLIHESTTGDVHQASLDEYKWRKYTSVDVGGGYQLGAVSDRSRHRFENMLVIDGVRDYAFSPYVSIECDNYYNLERLAYLYRDLPWVERISTYKFNNVTSFSSMN